MLQYLNEFIERMLEAAQPQRSNHGAINAEDLSLGMPDLVRELDVLEVRDFSPSVRAAFMMLRARLRQRARSVPGDTAQRLPPLLEQMKSLLDEYRGPASHVVPRAFPFVVDPELRAIVERDFKELCQILIPDGAWKSAVVMTGSIAEAVLLDMLQAAPQIAMAASRAPKRKGGGTVRDITVNKGGDAWTFFDLMNVAEDLGRLPHGWASTFHQALRDYRNFVHPAKERRSGTAADEGLAVTGHGVLIKLCDHLTR